MKGLEQTAGVRAGLWRGASVKDTASHLKPLTWGHFANIFPPWYQTACLEKKASGRNQLSPASRYLTHRSTGTVIPDTHLAKKPNSATIFSPFIQEKV